MKAGIIQLTWLKQMRQFLTYIPCVTYNMYKI
jgi:hypothetical protein